MIFMGDGDADFIKGLKKLQKLHPKKMVYLPYFQKNEHLETLLYAASDFFILPSNYEPCGINQMIAMRYGAIPIVRGVGGLFDTVDNFSPLTNKGTGFIFKLEDEFSFFGAVARALENYKHKKVWQELIGRAMLKSSSWEIPARKYLELYKKALKIKE
jgi:starch synthase